MFHIPAFFIHQYMHLFDAMIKPITNYGSSVTSPCRDVQLQWVLHLSGATRRVKLKHHPLDTARERHLHTEMYIWWSITRIHVLLRHNRNTCKLYLSLTSESSTWHCLDTYFSSPHKMGLVSVPFGVYGALTDWPKPINQPNGAKVVYIPHIVGQLLITCKYLPISWSIFHCLPHTNNWRGLKSQCCCAQSLLYCVQSKYI